ncbi:hypothetical protein H0H93_009834 [Arthromyces matolae]|nr:hypothetical protein H0H93_009834 [Arthromyces matolae]
MVTIRPQILVSASIISLALLLVSATPIPSSNAMSTTDTNGLITTNLPLFSQLQKPPSAKLIARNNDQGATDRVIELLKTISNEHISNDPLLKALQQLAEEIPRLSIPDGGDQVAIVEEIVGAMIKAKHIIFRWPQEKKDKVIEAIKACEGTINKSHLLNGARKGLENYQPPEELKKLLAELPAAIQGKSGKYTKDLLNHVVDFISHLSLEEQASMKTEMEDTYTEVKNLIVPWPPGPSKMEAKRLLSKWEEFNSLRGPLRQ